MRIWSILLIRSDLKWCIHLSRSLFLYLIHSFFFLAENSIYDRRAEGCFRHGWNPSNRRNRCYTVDGAISAERYLKHCCQKSSHSLCRHFISIMFNINIVYIRFYQKFCLGTVHLIFRGGALGFWFRPKYFFSDRIGARLFFSPALIFFS